MPSCCTRRSVPLSPHPHCPSHRLQISVPTLALTQSIDDTWQRAARSAHSTGAHPFSALKLQSDLIRSLEATAWLRLFNGCGRYQQAALTSLSMNATSCSHATSCW